MQSALTAPVFKSIALAGLALGLGAAASSRSPEPVTHRLKLHAVDRSDAVYFTAFRDGDIHVRFDRGAIQPFRIKVHARYAGCRWIGIETLVPRDGRSFDYDYTDHILGCEPDGIPTDPTPRKGIVTVED